MDELDKLDEFQSPHNLEYDLLMDHVVQDDHELLYLDTFLRETLGNEMITGDTRTTETI